MNIRAAFIVATSSKYFQALLLWATSKYLFKSYYPLFGVIPIYKQ